MRADAPKAIEVCRKKGFSSFKEAEIVREIRERKKGIPLHSYYCPKCTWWHHSRMSPDEAYEAWVDVKPELKELERAVYGDH